MIGYWNSDEDEALQYLPLRAQVIYLRGIRRYADQKGIAGVKRAISWKSLSEVAEVRPERGSRDPVEAPSRKAIRVAIAQLERAGLVAQLPQSERFKGLVFKCLLAPLDQSVQMRKGQGGAMVPQCNEGPRENLEVASAYTIGRANEGPRENNTQAGEEGPASPSPNISSSVVKRERVGTRLPEDWALPSTWKQWAEQERPDLDIAKVADIFKDHWLAHAGKEARKRDWFATWRNWIRREKTQVTPHERHQRPYRSAVSEVERSIRERQAHGDRHAPESGGRVFEGDFQRVCK